MLSSSPPLSISINSRASSLGPGQVFFIKKKIGILNPQPTYISQTPGKARHIPNHANPRSPITPPPHARPSLALRSKTLDNQTENAQRAGRYRSFSWARFLFVAACRLLHDVASRGTSCVRGRSVCFCRVCILLCSMFQHFKPKLGHGDVHVEGVGTKEGGEEPH